MDKASTDIRESLMRLVPTCESLASDAKIHLIQSLISRLIVDKIFREYFVGLPKARSQELKNMEQYLGGFGESDRVLIHFRSI